MHISFGQESIRLKVPSDAKYLALIRMVVVNAAETTGLAPAEIDKVEVAVDEACTNVLDHAYGDELPRPPIEIEIRISHHKFIVDIIDQGITFDFNAYVEPQFPDHWIDGHTRGVGLFLIRKFMDEAKYERLPDNVNRLRLVKNIPAAV